MAESRFRIADKYVVLDPWPDGFGYEHSDLSDIFCKRAMGGWVEPFPILGAQTHAGLTRASNGDLLLLFAEIESDLRPGSRFSLARSTDGGRTWATEAFPDFRSCREQARKAWVGGLMTTSAGTLLTLYSEFGSLPWRYRDWDDYREKTGVEFLRESYGLHLLSSNDNGRTWNREGSITTDQAELFPYSKIMELRDGSLLLPTTGHSRRGEAWRSGALRSLDGGKTWRFNTIAYPGDETPVVELSDGRLLGLNRAGVPGVTDTRLARHISSDGGETWSQHELTVMEGWADSVSLTGYPLLHISPSGTLMLIYRIYYCNEEIFAGPGISCSDDDGRTWKGATILEDPTEAAPYRINIGGWDIINLQDGKMLVLFSLINRSKYIVANVIEEV